MDLMDFMGEKMCWTADRGTKAEVSVRVVVSGGSQRRR